MEVANETFSADPLLVWPQEPRLGPMLSALQALNPGLGLRCATKRIGTTTFEYLVRDGNAVDVAVIAFPQPPADDLLAALTEHNRDWRGHATDLGNLRSGQQRIERTGDGRLLVRPVSWTACSEMSRFGRAYQWMDPRLGRQAEIVDLMGRIIRAWGILRPDDAIWEVDFAFMPDDFLTGKRTAREFWSITPVGTVSYIDGHDLPLEHHHDRAREIVAAGSAFAIVANIEAADMRIFRSGGTLHRTEDIRVPEMPWFHVPVPRLSP